MPEWTHRAVCEECDGTPGNNDLGKWVGAKRTSESHASITAETHDRRKHGGTETAAVREVDA